MYFNEFVDLLPVTLAILLVGGCREPLVKEPNNDASVLIMKVTGVDLALQEPVPPILVIKATGEVNTGRWTRPRLQARVYATPPADGIYEFEFKAVPPSGPAIQVISNVETTAEISDPDRKQVKGVRVISASNSIVKMR